MSVSEPLIQKRTCIAQLVPFVSYVPNAVDWSRGTGGFESTGAPQGFWTQKVTDQWLEKEFIITAMEHHPETVSTTGLIDT